MSTECSASRTLTTLVTSCRCVCPSDALPKGGSGLVSNGLIAPLHC